LNRLFRSERLRALAALVTAVVMFASSFVAIRAIISAGVFSPGQLVVSRMFVASICVALLAVVTTARNGAARSATADHRASAADTAAPPAVGFRAPKSAADWVAFLALGALGQGLYQLLLNTGERTVDASTAALLISCAPILASVMAVVFLGERMGAAGWVGTAIAFLGAIIIAVAAGVRLELGSDVLLVITATTLWAGYQVLQKVVAPRHTPLELAGWPVWIAFAALLPFFAAGLPDAIRSAPAPALWAVVWLGAFATVAGFLAWSYAIKRLPVVVSSNALFGVPVAAFLIALVFLGEVPAPLTFVGGAVVVGGVVLAQSVGRAEKSDALPQ